jgi:hypothetical protein
MDTLQGAIPVHVLQPIKSDFQSGVAESVTGLPVLKFALQPAPEPLQAIPEGELFTVPLPVPAVLTVRVAVEEVTCSDWVTSKAALKEALPPWLAMMVQVPALTPLTVVPLTVQMVGVEELKLTARPEVAVALAIVALPTAKVAGVKVMAPIV